MWIGRNKIGYDKEVDKCTKKVKVSLYIFNENIFILTLTNPK